MATKIDIYRGTSYPVIYNHTDSAGGSVPLTGKTLYFTVKADKYDTSATDATAIINKTVTSHTDAAAGVSGFTLTDVDTYVEPGKYYYTFLVEDDATHQSDPPTVMGVFTVLPQQNNRQVANG